MGLAVDIVHYSPFYEMNSADVFPKEAEPELNGIKEPASTECMYETLCDLKMLRRIDRCIDGGSAGLD
jgi:hypothetical protein